MPTMVRRPAPPTVATKSLCQMMYRREPLTGAVAVAATSCLSDLSMSVSLLLVLLSWSAFASAREVTQLK